MEVSGFSLSMEEWTKKEQQKCQMVFPEYKYDWLIYTSPSANTTMPER